MKKIKLANSGRSTVVDDDIYEIYSSLKWRLSTSGYAVKKHAVKIEDGSWVNTEQYLHHFIIGKKDGLFVDHINRDKLDNRRANLRFATKSQNNVNKPQKLNRSGYRGVYTQNRKTCVSYAVYITVKRKTIYLGCFRDVLKAAKKYNTAAKKYYGEFAILNTV